VPQCSVGKLAGNERLSRVIVGPPIQPPSDLFVAGHIGTSLQPSHPRNQSDRVRYGQMSGAFFDPEIVAG